MWNEIQLETVQQEIIKLYRLAYSLLSVPQGHKSASENAPIFIDVSYLIYTFSINITCPVASYPYVGLWYFGTMVRVCVI